MVLQSKQELFVDTKRIILENLSLNLTNIEQRELREITESVFVRGMANSLDLREKIRNNLPYNLYDKFNWEAEAAVIFLNYYYGIPTNTVKELLFQGIDRPELTEFVKRQQEREHHFTC